MCTEAPPDNVTSTTKVQLPPWLEGKLKTAASNAGDWYEQQRKAGYQPYPGDVSANWNQTQENAWAGAKNSILSSLKNNPYAGTSEMFDTTANKLNKNIGAEDILGDDKYDPKTIVNARLGNKFINNKYINKLIADASKDTTKAYSTGTAAQLDSAAAMGEAFGSSAYNEQKQQNQNTLADSLGQISTQVRADDLNRKRELDEARIDRALGLKKYNTDILNNAQQYNIGNTIDANKSVLDFNRKGDVLASTAVEQGDKAEATKNQFDISAYNNLFGLGAQKQGVAQQTINEKIANYNNKNNFMYDLMGKYSNLLQGYGSQAGQGSSTTGTNPNAAGGGGGGGAAGAISGATAGYGLATALGPSAASLLGMAAIPGIGWIGAGLGALAGLFG